MALGSPAAALLTNCLATASRLVIFLRLPSSVTATRLFSSFWIAVRKLLAPFGRPPGLPVVPGLNLVVISAGEKYRLWRLGRSVMGHLCLGCEGVETLASGGVDGVIARIGLPASNGRIDVQRVKLHAITSATHPLRCD